ncbi:hypothetical protein SNK05_008564 [Fusarium graminearum]|uniref:Chromosome 4, complete genome n=2 Tax=Gibberella zeae (strain ATCC MYA-4620 / CBS 123657 / FGSC 9075 / NRRL 31084 / PH-1) TaxID=229533 RepID=A0A098DN41_GIBZE|nr:unnamed protein product [Fusarium graminearum]CEF83291.1 unnamed protein product [Fusarium graminearum]
MSSTATASYAGSRAGSVASSNSKRSVESSDEEHPNKCSKLQHSTVKIRVEAPLLKDFTKEYGIPTAQFAWGPRPESPAEESFDEDETANPPSVPIINPKYPKPRNVARPINHLHASYLSHRDTLGHELDPPAETQPRRINRARPPKERSLMDLPAEIREEIYRGLLVSHKPVPVYDGWKKIYEREKPCLDINILMTCKKIFNEAIRVLYGENTFLYRLRDMPTESHRMINIQELAQSDAYVPSQGYRDQIRAEATCEAGTINIRKYACLFRYITLQADHNRSEFYTQEFMVDAIKTFAQEPGMTNIHTLTIIVSPCYTRGKFTFVDWFDSKSELVCALKAVCCEIIRIRIWNKHLNDGLGPISSELFLRVHQLRFLRQLEYQKLHNRKPQTGRKRHKPDIWAGDWMMEKLRHRRGREIISRLERLRPCVLEACKKHLEPHIKRQGDLEDADDNDDDDENWFAYFPDEMTGSEAEEDAEEDTDSD